MQFFGKSLYVDERYQPKMKTCGVTLSDAEIGGHDWSITLGRCETVGAPRHEGMTRKTGIAIAAVVRHILAHPGWFFKGLSLVAKLQFGNDAACISALEDVDLPRQPRKRYLVAGLCDDWFDVESVNNLFGFVFRYFVFE